MENTGNPSEELQQLRVRVRQLEVAGLSREHASKAIPAQACWQTLWESPHFALALWDEHGKVCTANATFCDWTGVSAAQIAGNEVQLAEVIFGHTLDSLLQLARTSRVEAHLLSVEIHSRNGALIPARLQLMPPDAGRAAGVCCLINDSALRKAHQRMNETEDRFRAFMDNNPAVAFIKDGEGRRVYLNETYYRVFGQGKREVMGKSDFELFPEDVAKALAIADQQVVQSGKPQQFVERVPTPDGIDRHWLIVKFPIPSQHGTSCIGGVAVDITAQKEVERTLRDTHRQLERLLADRTAEVASSQTRFLQLAENLDEVFWLYSPDERRMLYVSPAYAHVFGRPIDEVYADGESFLKVVDPVDLAAKCAVMTSNACDRYEVEFRLRDPTRGVRWLLARGFPVCDPETGSCRIASLIEDITDRKQAEIDVRLSETRFRKLFEQSPLSVQVLSTEGRLLRVNQAWQTLWGVQDDEVPFGLNLLTDPQLIEQGIVPHLLKALGGEPTITQPIPYQPDRGQYEGQEIWCRGVIYPVKNEVTNTIEEVVIVQEDITERKRAIDALRSSEERIRFALEAASDGLWDWNIVTGKLYCSSTIAALLRCGPEQLPQSMTEWQDWIHPADLPAMESALQSHLNDETAIYESEYRVQAFDGSWLWNQDRGRVIERDANRRPTRVIGALTDITARKGVEQRLRHEERLLRELLDLHERERQLIAYEIHDGFVQDVVGAQLTLEAVGGLLERGMNREHAAALFENSRALLRKAVDEGRRLINELRPLIIDEMGIVPAIEYLISQTPVDDALQIDFTHRLTASRLPPLLEGTLFRIAQESMHNVRRHSGATLAEIELGELDTMIYLEIRDNGRGFELDKVPDERFGLRGITERARLFGGAASIESAPGHGTRIRVTLPSTDSKKSAFDSDGR